MEESLKVDCLPNAVGKQPSIPLSGRMSGWTDRQTDRQTRQFNVKLMMINILRHNT